jgi:hypothetical protein
MDVIAHSKLRQVQLHRDFFLGQPFRYQIYQLPLPQRQVRPARQSTDLTPPARFAQKTQTVPHTASVYTPLHP